MRHLFTPCMRKCITLPFYMLCICITLPFEYLLSLKCSEEDDFVTSDYFPVGDAFRKEANS